MIVIVLYSLLNSLIRWPHVAVSNVRFVLFLAVFIIVATYLNLYFYSENDVNTTEHLSRLHRFLIYNGYQLIQQPVIADSTHCPAYAHNNGSLLE